MKSFIFCLIISAFFLLYGCGGGGSAAADLPSDPGTVITPPEDDSGSTDPETTAPVSAVTGLKSGWSQNIIFNADILYPVDIFKDNSGNVYTYSSTDSSTTLAKLDSGELKKVFDIGQSTMGWGFQTVNNRFIFTTATSALYAVNASGSATRLKMYGVIGNRIAVSSDDSFYTCSGSDRYGVYKYDSSGNYLGTIADSVNICSGIALDNSGSNLYYTSSYEGNVYKVNLSSNTKTLIGSGFGIPGTYEPITLGFDSSGTLYVFSGAEGLYKYTGSGFQKIIDSISGAGSIVWSAAYNAFLMGVGAGANIVAYYTGSQSAANLTEHYNAVKIAVNGSGETLICNNDNFLSRVTADGFENFLTGLESQCTAMTADGQDNVYVAIANGKILRLSGASATVWNSMITSNIIDMAYSRYDGSMVVAYLTGSDSVKIAKVKTAVTDLYSFTGISVNNAVPAVAADDSGNIYVLERKANKIYKIENSGSFSVFASDILESEAITMPDMVFSSRENALIVSTINDYKLIPVNQPSAKTTFAVNNGSVDNFAMQVNSAGVISAVHSGQVFQMFPE